MMQVDGAWGRALVATLAAALLLYFLTSRGGRSIQALLLAAPLKYD